MSLHRIYGIVLRFLFLQKRNLDRQFQMLFFPVMELFLWGLTSSYIQDFAPERGINGLPFFLTMIVSGIVLWIIIYRTYEEVPFNVLEELWNRNLINIFVSPLSFTEWIVAFLLLAFMKLLLSVSVAAAIAFLLYKVNIFFLGWYLLPFFALLMMTGWWIGFFVTGLILRYGTAVQAFAWTFGFMIAPFSGIYYPISSLPSWAQAIAKVIPTSHIFEGMREVLQTGHLDPRKLYISLGINLVLILATLLFMRDAFKKRLQRGLLSLE